MIGVVSRLSDFPPHVKNTSSSQQGCALYDSLSAALFAMLGGGSRLDLESGAVEEARDLAQDRLHVVVRCHQ